MSDYRDLVEFDWLVTRTGDVLHFADVSPQDSEALVDEAQLEDVLLACGRRVKSVHVPGVFTRMYADRCSRCCRAVGYPTGKGSPKNDPLTRPLALERIDVLHDPVPSVPDTQKD